MNRLSLTPRITAERYAKFHETSPAVNQRARIAIDAVHATFEHKTEKNESRSVIA